jgi:hypothetical protein
VAGVSARRQDSAARSMNRRRIGGAGACLAVAGILWLRAPANAQAPPAWPDTFLARVEALALIQTLNADILGSRSATASLETWCRDHRLAADPTIIARAVRGGEKAAAPDTRQRLELGADDAIKYRRVELRCGSRLLSEADNWYVPGRLTPEMNHLLETSETPFGKVVESLQPYRRTFAVQMLWSPLPRGWEQSSTAQPAGSASALAIPAAVFAHRAVLYTREHRPFSEVNEVYQRDVLGFPAPSAR